MSKNPILELIAKQEEINSHAYNTFLSDYIRRYPEPKSDTRLIMGVLIVSAFASMIVSGAFTIPTFERILLAIGAHPFLATVVGVSGFILFDLMLLAMSYKMADMVYRPQAMKGAIQNGVMIRNMAVIFFFGAVVSFGSNLYCIRS